MKSDFGELYKLDFPNGKSYIGVTTKGAHNRYKEHAKNAISGKTVILSKAWRKYGAPSLLILAILEQKMLLKAEQTAIQVFRTLFPGGYNMTLGGETSPLVIPEILARARINMAGKIRSEDHKEKIRQAQLKRNQDPKVREKNKQAQLNWHRENKVSDKTRAKLSLVSLGLKRSEVTKAKMALRVRERRQELSDNWLGDNNPMKRPEVAKKTSQKLKGRIFTKEHKAKISAACRGRKLSPEHKAKFFAGLNRPEVQTKLLALLRGPNAPVKSAVVRAKISAALKGRNLIEEHRIKTSLS